MTKRSFEKDYNELMEDVINTGNLIYNRIRELEKIRDNYLAYQKDRVAEHDHHGAWDVAVNLSETECEISGLQFAFKLINAV